MATPLYSRIHCTCPPPPMILTWVSNSGGNCIHESWTAVISCHDYSTDFISSWWWVLTNWQQNGIKSSCFITSTWKCQTNWNLPPFTVLCLAQRRAEVALIVHPSQKLFCEAGEIGTNSVPLITLQCTEKVLPFYYLWLQIYLMLKVTQHRINSSLQRWPWIARLISFVIFFSCERYLLLLFGCFAEMQSPKVPLSVDPSLPLFSIQFHWLLLD